MSAIYHAVNWADGKSKSEIEEEIQRLEDMWTSKLANPFPKSAHWAYTRLETLKAILNDYSFISNYHKNNQ